MRYSLTLICNKAFVSLDLAHGRCAGVAYPMKLIKVNLRLSELEI